MIDSRVDRAQDRRQGLVDKDEDEGDLLEVPGVADLSASAGRTTRRDRHGGLKGQHGCPAAAAATPQLRPADLVTILIFEEMFLFNYSGVDEVFF